MPSKQNVLQAWLVLVWVGEESRTKQFGWESNQTRQKKEKSKEATFGLVQFV